MKITFSLLICLAAVVGLFARVDDANIGLSCSLIPSKTTIHRLIIPEEEMPERVLQSERGLSPGRKNVLEMAPGDQWSVTAWLVINPVERPGLGYRHLLDVAWQHAYHPTFPKHTPEKANAWYIKQGWLVGCNYIPAYAINQLEMWQADTFDTFLWARAVNPSQPVCATIWSGDWSSHANMKEIDRFIVENSDVINFHLYTGPEEFSKQVGYLKRYNRPLFCTEYLARPVGSTFQNILPIAKQNNVAAYNWGFMEGKIQTAYPWDSWDKPYDHEPTVWFHDIFRKDGTPYRQQEVEFIKQITGKDK